MRVRGAALPALAVLVACSPGGRDPAAGPPPPPLAMVEGVDTPLVAPSGTADSLRRAGPDRFLWGFPTTASFLEADPSTVGMSADALARVDSILLAAVEAGGVPGAALAVGRHGRLVRLRGYGWLDHDRARQASPATLYDLASLTKVIGTTTGILLLEQEGRLSLDDRVVEHLPGWDRGDPAKGAVTLRQLLVHRGGLAPFRPWFGTIAGKEAYRAAVYDEPLESPPGSRTLYSDLGAITLGLVVEAVSGHALDAFLGERLFGPLAMEDTRFLPDTTLLPRIAPTEVDTVWRHRHVHGTVHDENAHAMGGVAGHAGIFSTAFDLAVFADLLLRGGTAPACEPSTRSGLPCARPRSEPLRLLDPALLARYTRRQEPSSSRALGWDTPEGRSSAGDRLSERSFGHTGFTGTSIWIDPELDLYVVLLTNRVNPTRENMAHIALRRAVHDQVALAITDRSVPIRGGGR